LSVYRLAQIKELAEALSQVQGVLAVILFGSYARGEQNEGSDVDLLILFEDKKNLEKGREALFEITSKRNLFVSMVALTVDELRTSTLLSPILRDGKVLFARQPFDLQSLANFKPHVIITYSAKSMSQRDKVKFVQRLYGRKSGKYSYGGLLERVKGYKIGRNCFMVPLDSAKEAMSFLDKHRVYYEVRYVWLPT
jgi:predicted nucleotidyltransferase